MPHSTAMLPLSDSILLRLRIEALMADYVHCLDADELEEWPDFFTGDAHYKVCTRENFDRGLPLSVMSCSGRGMFRDRITALRTANIYEPHVYCHLLGPFRIVEYGSERAQAEGNFQVIRTMPDGTMSIFACGRSFDQFSVQDGTLKISERIVILDSRQIDTLLVIPL